MSDTQMELRLYSAEFLSYPSSAVRYKFEIENLVKLLWPSGKMMVKHSMMRPV